MRVSEDGMDEIWWDRNVNNCYGWFKNCYGRFPLRRISIGSDWTLFHLARIIHTAEAKKLKVH